MSSDVEDGSERAPLVSVVIPCWNGEAYLAEAISSALDQDHPRMEVIVVDDGSSDRSLEIARSFERVVAIPQANAGVSAARNAGLARARGEYILFLDADDRLLPGAIAAHLRGFATGADISMVYGGNRIIDSRGEVIGLNPQPARRFSWREVLFGVTPTPSQSMFRRDALEAVGAFNRAVSLGEDFDLYMRLTKAHAGYCHGETIADYRRHDLQATKQPTRSLASMLGVVDAFRATFPTEIQRDEIWSQGRRHWRVYYGQYIPIEVAKSLLRRQWRRAATGLRVYAQHLPDTALGSARYVLGRVGGLLARRRRADA